MRNIEYNYFSTKTRLPVRYERLIAQANIFAPGTEVFLKAVRRCISNTKKALKVFDLGCSLGDETDLLARLFPQAEIIAIDPMSDYIRVARDRYQLENVHFQTGSFDNLGELVENYGVPDLIYFRMVLMHFNNPKEYLFRMCQYLPANVFFAIEEPDVSQIMTEPEVKSFKDFINLILKYGLLRKENYHIGAQLISILREHQKKIFFTSDYHPILNDINQRKLIKYLVEDLLPRFEKLKLAEPTLIQEIRQRVLSTVNNPEEVIKYCQLKQVLFAS